MDNFQRQQSFRSNIHFMHNPVWRVYFPKSECWRYQVKWINNAADTVVNQMLINIKFISIIRDLVTYFLEGLKKRSKFVIALQDYKPGKSITELFLEN